MSYCHFVDIFFFFFKFATVEACMTAVSDIVPSMRRRKALLAFLTCSFFVLTGLILCTEVRVCKNVNIN